MDAGVSFYGYREYSPGMGRWISPDGIREMGGPNLLVFVLNTPSTLLDALGLDPEAIPARRVVKRYVDSDAPMEVQISAPSSVKDSNVAGSTLRAVYMIDVRFRVQGAVAYCDCSGKVVVKATSFEFSETYKRDLALEPVLWIPGEPLSGVNPKKFATDLMQALRRLLAEEVARQLGPEVKCGPALASGLLANDQAMRDIADLSPKSLAQMDMVDVKFVPCPEDTESGER